jgi:DNA-binding response OmpR family regulator
MYKILVVDDEEKITAYLERFLTKKGFKVYKADNGKQALEIIDKEAPDLLVLDERMPILNGSGVLSGMAQRKVSIPVIMISGSAETTETMERFKSMGYEDVLFKPVDLNVILEKINKKLVKEA